MVRWHSGQTFELLGCISEHCQHLTHQVDCNLFGEQVMVRIDFYCLVCFLMCRTGHICNLHTICMISELSELFRHITDPSSDDWCSLSIFGNGKRLCSILRRCTWLCEQDTCFFPRRMHTIFKILTNIVCERLYLARCLSLKCLT